MEETVSIIVKGKVQGVFFRQSTREKAAALGITGEVKNNSDGSVRITARGGTKEIAELISWCHTGPARAAVTEVKWEKIASRNFDGFRVIR